MKYTFLIIILLGLSVTVSGQFFSGPNSNPQTLTGPQSVLKTEIPLAKPSVIGSTYLNETWQPAQIVLKNGHVIESLPIRVEIEQANIEIQYNGEIKYLDLKEVDFVNFTEGTAPTKSVIKKGNAFTFKEVPMNGIVAIHNYGELYSIVKHFSIEFLQANYNVAMDVGSKDHRKVKREKLYISQGQKLVLAKGSGKKIAAQLGADKEKALAIINEHGLNLSREADLITFVSLMQSQKP
jgi:hypothetical protein